MLCKLWSLEWERDGKRCQRWKIKYLPRQSQLQTVHKCTWTTRDKDEDGHVCPVMPFVANSKFKLKFAVIFLMHRIQSIRSIDSKFQWYPSASTSGQWKLSECIEMAANFHGIIAALIVNDDYAYFANTFSHQSQRWGKLKCNKSKINILYLFIYCRSQHSVLTEPIKCHSHIKIKNYSINIDYVNGWMATSSESSNHFMLALLRSLQSLYDVRVAWKYFPKPEMASYTFHISSYEYESHRSCHLLMLSQCQNNRIPYAHCTLTYDEFPWCAQLHSHSFGLFVFVCFK